MERNKRVYTKKAARSEQTLSEGPRTRTSWTVCYTIKLLNDDDNGNFNAYDPMTRAQAAVVLYNIHGYVTGLDQPAKSDAPARRGGGRALRRHRRRCPRGWITEAEVQAVLDQLRIDYPDGSPWGSSDQWWSPAFGDGSEFAGFTNMVSDRIFGTLPKYEVQIEDTRVRDVLEDGPANHKNIALNDYGKLIFEDVNYDDGYYTADGNVSGEVRWDTVNYYADWPTGTHGTVIYSRYLKE